MLGELHANAQAKFVFAKRQSLSGPDGRFAGNLAASYAYGGLRRQNIRSQCEPVREKEHQALWKADSESNNEQAPDASRPPRIERVTGALQLMHAASPPIVKKRSRVAVASIAAGV